MHICECYSYIYYYIHPTGGKKVIDKIRFVFLILFKWINKQISSPCGKWDDGCPHASH